MKKTLIYTAAVVLLASCSSEQTTQTPAAAEATAATPAAGHNNHMMAATTPADPMTEDGLPKELVCMVNNAYMGKKQFPVEFEDKMYYGCCEMCVNTIKQQREVRYATDPFSGEEVDKSSAFIALKPGSPNGNVLYFASEENYRKYLE